MKEILVASMKPQWFDVFSIFTRQITRMFTSLKLKTGHYNGRFRY
jgi:predicted nuclease of restriction endonuclease-like (RecB) superfamily